MAPIKFTDRTGVQGLAPGLEFGKLGYHRAPYDMELRVRFKIRQDIYRILEKNKKILY